MDHRGDGIKIDTTAWESPRPREGGRFITGNTPSLHPYPISLSSVGDDCQRFHCGREKGKKTMEVYRCCIRIHVYIYAKRGTISLENLHGRVCFPLARRRISGNGGQLVVLKDSGARYWLSFSHVAQETAVFARCHRKPQGSSSAPSYS